MNLEQMRTVVRQMLGDTNSGNHIFDDEALNKHIKHALEIFSRHVPLEKYTEIETTPGSAEIDIQSLSGRLNVTKVRYPADEHPCLYRCFSVWGDTLTLMAEDVPDGSKAGIYYAKLHSITGSESTLEGHHASMVAAGAAGLAALGEAARSFNRVNAGGKGVGQSYRAWGRERLEAFRQAAFRLGRKRSVGAVSLYRGNFT